VILYAILGVPVDYINKLRNGSNFDRTFGDILANICIDPDDNILSDSIGSLRNFISKSHFEALHQEKDQFGFTFIEYFVKLVKLVHENQDKKYSETDRLIVLTIYISLVEFKMAS